MPGRRKRGRHGKTREGALRVQTITSNRSRKTSIHLLRKNGGRRMGQKGPGEKEEGGGLHFDGQESTRWIRCFGGLRGIRDRGGGREGWRTGFLHYRSWKKKISGGKETGASKAGGKKEGLGKEFGQYRWGYGGGSEVDKKY